MKSTPQEVKEIWSLIKETQQNIKETQQNIKEISASQKENEVWIKRFSIETNKFQKETNEQIKKTNEGLKKARELFETQWGKLMESLVEGDLVKILNEKGIKVINTHTNINHRSEKDQYEYDIVVTNGKEIVVVEVKTTLKVKHVKYFLEDLKKFPVRVPAFKKNIIYGAVAYLRAEEEATRYSEKQGLFVIRATGSSASIINRKGFKPKAFIKN